jgi:hypothetical protein
MRWGTVVEGFFCFRKKQWQLGMGAGGVSQHLRQFGKLIWHPSHFSKTTKIDLQQFDKPT